MAHLELSIFVEATPEQIWPILADFEGQKSWMVDLRTLDITSAVKEGVGARMKVTSELFGLPVVKDDMVVDYWQPPYFYSVIHIGQFSGTGYFELRPAEGGTDFIWVEDFKPLFGRLGESGFSLIVRPHLQKVFLRSMNNVKRLAEAAALSEAAIT